jgi:CheY-like chemotaxis protein
MQNSTSILLIEDDKHDQYFFSQAILEIASVKLWQVANNGREALDILRSADHLPDLIFTDIHMPVMDGVECVSEIKKLPNICDIPVVVLSSDTSKIEILTKMGVKVFIEKPGDYILLQRLLAHVLAMDFEITDNVELQAITSGHYL